MTRIQHPTYSTPKHNVYICLIDNPSPFTAARIKAKVQTVHMYFHFGWVNNAAVWEVTDKKVSTVKAKVRAKLANITHLPNDDLGVVNLKAPLSQP